jgi:hypothetical protein
MAYRLLNENSPEASHGSDGNPLLGIGKAIARTPLRAAESIAGIPGEAQQGLAGQAYGAGNKAIGEILGNLIGAKYEAPEAGNAFNTKFPTTGEIKEKVTQPLTGGVLEPTTETGRSYDEFVQDVTGNLAPALLGMPTLGLKGAAKVAGVGQLAKFGAKKIGLGKENQEGIKFGSMLLANVLGVGANGKDTFKGIDKYKKELYSNAEQALERNPVRLKADPINTQLKNARTALNKRAFDGTDEVEKILNRLNGITKPGKNAANPLIEGPAGNLMLNPDREKTITGQHAWDLIKDLNSQIYSDKLTPEAKRFTEKTIKPILDKLIDQISEKVPEFAQVRMGNEIHAASKNWSPFKGWINKWINWDKLKMPLLASHVFGVSIPKAIGGYAAGAVGREAYNSIETLLKSPTAQKHLIDAFKAASLKQAVPFARAVKLLDNEAAELNPVRAGRYKLID